VQDVCFWARAARWPWAYRMWVFQRICYHLATPALAALSQSETIYKVQRFSDHAPITVDYDMNL
jgi:exodeoxyribonuclease-3